MLLATPDSRVTMSCAAANYMHKLSVCAEFHSHGLSYGPSGEAESARMNQVQIL